VNLRTLQDLEACLLEQTTAAADTTVSNVMRNHANILNRVIRTKSLDLSPDGSTEKNINMSNHQIVELKDADLETGSEAVNFLENSFNRKIQSEIEINNHLELLKYLRLEA